MQCSKKKEACSNEKDIKQLIKSQDKSLGGLQVGKPVAGEYCIREESIFNFKRSVLSFWCFM